MTNKNRLGAGGFCICPKCKYNIGNQKGTPCQEMKCPKCGAKMLREWAYHHQLFEKKEERQQKN